jgi:hypothetical protein
MEKVLSALSLSDKDRQLIEPYWLESGSYEHDVKFLSRDFIKKYFSLFSDDRELYEQICCTAGLIDNDSALKRLIEHARYRLCFSDDTNFSDWPELEASLGKNCGIFYLLVGISAIPEIFKTFKRLGMPESMAADCSKWLNGCVGIYRSSHDGNPGMCKRQLHWVRHYIDGILFRIGRLEFMNQTLPEFYNVNVWQSKSNGVSAAFLNDGIRINKDGYVMYEDDDPETFAFENRLSIEGKRLTGNPCLPSGTVSPETVTLDLNEWEPVIYKDCFIPGVHIPGGGRMTLEACKESFAKAEEFYKRYFPDKKLAGFICASWIFYPEFEKRLPESNLATLMRELYLFPCRVTGRRHGLFFLFGRDDGDLKDYPRDNSVRRAMLEITDEGKPLRCGAMFILPQDIPKFGGQFYRNSFPF